MSELHLRVARSSGGDGIARYARSVKSVRVGGADCRDVLREKTRRERREDIFSDMSGILTGSYANKITSSAPRNANISMFGEVRNIERERVGKRERERKRKKESTQSEGETRNPQQRGIRVYSCSFTESRVQTFHHRDRSIKSSDTSGIHVAFYPRPQHDLSPGRRARCAKR